MILYKIVKLKQQATNLKNLHLIDRKEVTMAIKEKLKK